jgi:hypothetical protein
MMALPSAGSAALALDTVAAGEAEIRADELTRTVKAGLAA